MNVIVVAFLTGALLGVVLFLMVSEWVPRVIAYWREADAAQGQRVRDVRAADDLDQWEEEHERDEY